MFDSATRGTRAALGGLMLGTVMAALTLTACGLFDIRDPVEPSGDGGACAGQPASSDAIVLESFALAMLCGQDGLGLYDRTLGTAFVFELDPLDAADFEGRDTLTRAEVYQAHQTIVNVVADSLYFEFTLVQPEREDTKATYLDMPYMLEVYFPKEDEPDSVGTFSGSVDLTVVEAGAGDWVMLRWVDQGGGVNPTLGAFYATYALQSGSGGRRKVLD